MHRLSTMHGLPLAASFGLIMYQNGLIDAMLESKHGVACIVKWEALQATGPHQCTWHHAAPAWTDPHSLHQCTWHHVAPAWTDPHSLHQCTWHHVAPAWTDPHSLHQCTWHHVAPAWTDPHSLHQCTWHHVAPAWTDPHSLLRTPILQCMLQLT